MSVKEKFDRRYGIIVESCSDDVLEAVDYLIDASTELEVTNELLRKRISALERENNILRSFYSDIEFSETDIDNMRNAIEDVTSVVELADKLKNTLTTSASVFSEIAAFNADVADRKKECEALLAQNTSSHAFSENKYDHDDSDELYEEDDEISPHAYPDEAEDTDDSIVDLTDDEQSTDVSVDDDSEGDTSADMINAIADGTASNIVDDDIAEKLKNMLRDATVDEVDEASDSNDDPVNDADTAADDISALILKMMSDAENDFPKTDPSDELPVPDTTESLKVTEAEEPVIDSQIEPEEKTEPVHPDLDKKDINAEPDINIDADVDIDIEIEEKGRSFFTNTKKQPGTDPQTTIEIIEPALQREEPKVENVNINDITNITPPEKKERENLKSIKDSLAKIKNKRRGI